MALSEHPAMKIFCVRHGIFVQLGGGKITEYGTMFLYFHDNFLPTENASEGKADL